ncbi:MAG: sel1 repeat family protein [Cytophagales bacterium]|nr:sel1 repeat family protein [Cytophagales bacterium]MDW8384752.1 tetratricopeptide repeat protein [Flammeovirgaceae bacterium]
MQKQWYIVVISILFFTIESWGQYSGEKLKELQKRASQKDAYAIWMIGKFYEEGSNGYKQDYHKAFKQYEQAAKLKFDSALFDLGKLYANGLGTPKDTRKASECFQLAAKNGKHAQALFEVARMEFKGIEISQNQLKATSTFLMLWRKFGLQEAKDQLQQIDIPKYADTTTVDYIYYMATQGNAYYMYRLAQLYEEGKEMPKDPAQAFVYYQKSANHQYLPAVLALARCYEQGIGTTANQERAVRLYLQASNEGSLEAQSILKNYDLNQYLNPNEVIYLQFKASTGDAREMFVLSEKYAKGEGVARDFNKSIELLEKSASLDYLPAILKLASYYEKGELVPKNDTVAFKLYRRGAFMNNDTARFMMAEMLMNGRGCKQDTRLAINQYLLAANNGHELSRARLRQLNLKEFISPTDVQYLRYIAQNEENKDAMYELGITYLKANDLQGLSWIKRASTLGHPAAQILWGEILLNGYYNTPKDHAGALSLLAPYAQKGNLKALILVAQMINRKFTPANFSREMRTKILLAANQYLLNPKNFEKADTSHLTFCIEFANIYLDEQDFQNVTFYLNRYEKLYDDTLNKPLEILNVLERNAAAYFALSLFDEAIYLYQDALLRLENYKEHPHIQLQYNFLKAFFLKELAKAQYAKAPHEKNGACQTLQQAKQLGMNIQGEDFAEICKNP